MTPEWREVEALFHAARQCVPDQRASFLDDACGADTALRREVESLLAADDGASGFLEPPTERPRTEPDLTLRLQAALGAIYRIEREFGGGGMSRVFLATDTALGRRVVVKVLPPELTAAVNVERFRREIRLAASLQHPNIVPLLAAEQGAELLYYTMPFVEGESLKDRLRREGALPVREAVQLLREVVDALRYAHRHGVVHRDVKPANVLLKESHPLVTDFGIAKAVSAATQETGAGATLTSSGIVPGTPAYIAPEQAAGNPATDHRADLYALGVLAYEMLTGELPFHADTPQQMVAAHLVETPEPIGERRPGLPRSFASLVMRLLEKDPADRPQSADEVLKELEAVAETLSAETAARDSLDFPFLATSARRRWVIVASVLALYLVFSLALLGATRVATVQLGLPDWVMPSAALLLLIGLPVILTTAVVQGARRGREGLARWLTWRRAITGGVLAFAALGTAAAGYMAIWALGMGPVGSLAAAGVLKGRERLLVADFGNRTSDSTLAAVVTEALRIDLSQSPVVTLLPPDQVAEALTRMKRPTAGRLDATLAREVAVREGVKAVLTGEVARAGAQYVLAAQLVSAGSGEVLAAQRETARDSSEIIAAVDRLSKRLRRRIGESLRSLRRDPPLERVTTASLEALRKYTAATRAINAEGDLEKALVLFDESIARDSGFAVAYQQLGMTLFNLGKEEERRLQALTKAFQYRDRLPERERYMVQGNYYQSVTFEPEKAMAAYRALLERYPDDWEALNELGWLNMIQGQQPRAQELFHRAIALDSSKYPPYANLIISQLADGKRADAERTMHRVLELFPNSPDVVWNASDLASSGGDYATAEAYARRLAERYGDNAYYRANAADHLARLAAIRGRLAEAERHARDAMQIAGEAGYTSSYHRYAALLGAIDVRLRRDPKRALNEVERALAKFPLDSMKPFDRLYLTLAEFYALAGKPERARELVKEFERLIAPPLRRWDERHRHDVMGQVELAEGHLPEAISELRQAPTNGPLCPLCGLTALGIAYDLSGKRDSAIIAYERYVTTPSLYRVMQDATQLAGVYKRLGELYEARGDREKAAHYYSRFLELWKDSDPELRSEVVDAQRRLASLGREPAK